MRQPVWPLVAIQLCVPELEHHQTKKSLSVQPASFPVESTLLFVRLRQLVVRLTLLLVVQVRTCMTLKASSTSI